MTLLTVGAGQQYVTIAAAVTASHTGDTINVLAGTYRNDFVHIDHSLALQAVGGPVIMMATVPPPDGKAILTEGGAGIDVKIDGFVFTGAAVPDANGADIRYEGGTLTITNSHFFGNQNGILGAADPNGAITISHSEFDHNGIDGGRTHNIYIGDISSFTLSDSFIHDANVGHEVKSRAKNNTIINNRIFDNNSTASYSIDLPNGGNATITGNIIEQGVNSQNSNIIAYGEEGSLHAETALSVTDNTLINDAARGPALWNSSAGTVATFTNNAVHGFGGNALVTGASNQSGTTVLVSRPTLDQSAPYAVATTPTPEPTPTPVPTIPVPTPTSGLVVNVSEDAWLGDAQFTISVDGAQVAGVHTATASRADGQIQAFAVDTTLSAGTHQIGISFINDAWGGTPDTDRNLYVTGATLEDQPIAGSATTLFSNGTATFDVTVGTPGGPPSSVTSTLTLNISEDAWLGNAQFTVTVDGQQMGDVHTATASRAAGQSQAFTFANIAEMFSPHDIAVSFLNDAYGGTPETDRNLHVDSVLFDGQSVPGGSATLFSNDTGHFTALAPANWMG
jgi:hypothetical protein